MNPRKKPSKSREKKPPVPGITKNMVVDLDITDLEPSGEGSGIYRDIPVLISRTMPGDRVKIKIKNTALNRAFGELVQVLQPSDKRREPGCSSFIKGCGGCQWLHIDYAEQQSQKVRLMRNLFRRSGFTLDLIKGISGMADPTGCRNKLSLLNQDEALSFMMENSRENIELPDCPQETLAIRKAYVLLKKIRFPKEIQQIHLRSNREGKIGVCFFVRSARTRSSS